MDRIRWLMLCQSVTSLAVAATLLLQVATFNRLARAYRNLLNTLLQREAEQRWTQS